MPLMSAAGAASSTQRILAAHQHLPRVRRDLTAEHRLRRRRPPAARATRRAAAPTPASASSSRREASSREREPEVDAVEDRAGVHPRVARLGPAVRRLVAEDRLRRGSATTCAVRGVVSGCAPARAARDATSSNGVFTFARYAVRLKNSGHVTICARSRECRRRVRRNVARGAIDERLRRIVAHEADARACAR